MDVLESCTRAAASSTASKATKAATSVAWSYEPSPPQRRAMPANGLLSVGDDLRAIEACVEQLSRMTQLMRVITNDGA